MSDSAPPPGERNETPVQRADRNLTDLLGELRIALPGVQVLFAFLLAVPFQPRFEDVTNFQERAYFATLLLAALASALLIAPSAYHRINFARGDKPHIVRVANRLSLAGLGVLVLAMNGAILLVTDWLFSRSMAVTTTAFTTAVFLALWLALPLARRVTVRNRATRGPAGR